eukprot:scaffold72700_cov22-Cyclotella_meneghiniana.AAC.1
MSVEIQRIQTRSRRQTSVLRLYHLCEASPGEELRPQSSGTFPSVEVVGVLEARKISRGALTHGSFQKRALKMANFGRPLQRLHCRYRPPPGAINCFEDLKRRILSGIRKS